MEKKKKKKRVSLCTHGHTTNNTTNSSLEQGKDPYANLYKHYIDQDSEERLLEEERRRKGYYD